jgi:uncharacterized membrane protein
MSKSSPFPALIAYIPVIGWLYVYFTQRQNPLAVFHLRQSVGLFLFLVATFVIWVIVGYLIALIPYMAVFSVALFTIVIAIYIFGVVAWVAGIVNALNNRSTPLPFFGQWANRLPIA